MVTDTVEIPELERGIETHGIERVEPTTRPHFRIFDNLTMWLSANLVVSTVVLGALANILGLGFWDSVLAILIFNALGVLPVAFFSTLGPKLGLRQMTISRFSFGWVGAMIMAIFNVAACIGWSTVNVIVGGQLVEALSRGAIPQPVGVLFIAILTTLFSIYGYTYIHRYERYAWIPMALIFFVLLAVAGPRLSIVPTPPLSIAEIASFVSFGGAIYGFATGWSSYAADYNVNQPQDTPTRTIFWLTFLGVYIPCVLLEILGMVLADAYVSTPIYKQLNGNLFAAAAQPLGSFGTLILFLLALSVVANNIPNDYSLGLSMQVLGRPFQRINRAVWALVGAVIYVLVAVPASGNFNETLQNFMLIIAYWLGPWAIILTLEHFVFRRGRYNVGDWNTSSRLPVGWAAIVSFFIGLGGVLLGASQVYYTGPLAHALSGMDIGFELGVVFAGIAYYLLRRVELTLTGR